jgi:hypothetical protein
MSPSPSSPALSVEPIQQNKLYYIIKKKQEGETKKSGKFFLKNKTGHVFTHPVPEKKPAAADQR